MAITRRQLRRDVMANLGDITILVATANGTDVTFIDTNNLDGEVNRYRGQYVLFAGGTAANIGQQRYITGSSSTQRAIGFGIPLPAYTMAGDEAEMINGRGIGYQFQDVHNSINEHLRMIAQQVLVTSGANESPYAYGSPIVLPPEWRTVEFVQWQDQYDQYLWRNVPKADRPNGNGWWVDKATRTLNITGKSGQNISGFTARVWGLVEPAELYDDNDVTVVDAEWLKFAVVASMLRMKQMKMFMPEMERMMFQLSQKADALREKINSKRSPFSEALN